MFWKTLVGVMIEINFFRNIAVSGTLIIMNKSFCKFLLLFTLYHIVLKKWQEGNDFAFTHCTSEFARSAAVFFFFSSMIFCWTKWKWQILTTQFLFWKNFFQYQLHPSFFGSWKQAHKFSVVLLIQLNLEISWCQRSH